jgi:hypothetical protein
MAKRKNVGPVAPVLPMGMVPAGVVAPVPNNAVVQAPTPVVAPVVPPAPINPAAVPRPAMDSAARDALHREIAVKAGATLIATGTYVEIGAFVANALIWAKERTEGWESSHFDAEISSIRAACEALYPDPDRLTAMRPDDWFRAYAFVAECNKLGILGADRVSYARIVNALFSAGFTLEKIGIGATVRDGWAEWLKVAVPRNVNGAPDCMSGEALKESILAQRNALHTAAPDKHKAPPKPKKSKKGPKPGRGTAAPAPTPKTATGAPAPATIPLPTVAAPSIVKAPNGADMTAESAAALGKALVDAKNYVAIIALHREIIGTIQSMQSAMSSMKATG